MEGWCREGQDEVPVVNWFWGLLHLFHGVSRGGEKSFQKVMLAMHGFCWKSGWSGGF